MSEDGVTAVRTGAGLFRLPERGVLAVTGSDAVRWLDGMVTNDVASLEPGGPGSGCQALVLTTKGRIVADLHVLRRPDGFWLELPRDAIAAVVAHLDRYIVADDVTLTDRSADFDRLGVEGPAARERLGAPDLPRESWAELSLAGQPVVAARFGWSGEDAFQLFAPAGAGDAVAAVLDGLPEADAGVLDVLRVEAGIPALGPELDEEVLPDEARLEHAISRTKGCYTGQEIVARVHARGAVNHLLVGLRFAGEAPDAEAPLERDGRRTGEVTSTALSPTEGPIGLGYVRREDAEPGTALVAGGVPATVVALPAAGPGLGGVGSASAGD